MNYQADSQSIGEWDGFEDDAIELWNNTIAPVLEEMHSAIEGDGGDTESVGHAQQWAWDRFCATIDFQSDAESAASRIADELRTR